MSMSHNQQILAFFASGGPFGAFFFPVAWRRTQALVSPYLKADTKRRLIAAAIDGVLCAVCIVSSTISKSVSLLAFGSLYLLVKDSVLFGRSVGKLVSGLAVVQLDNGKPCDLSRSIQRNWVFLIPGMNIVAFIFEGIAVIRDPQGMRLGDRFAVTQVVEGKDAKELAKFVLDRLSFVTMIEEELRPRGRAGEPRATSGHNQLKKVPLMAERTRG